MISISTPTFDLAGSFVAQNGTAVAAPLSRRARRVATLDGGVVVSDLGFSVGDIDYTITLRSLTRDQYAWLTEKLEGSPNMILSCDDGCFLVLLSNLHHSDGITTLTAQVLAKLSL